MKNYSKRLPIFSKEGLRQILSTPAPNEEKERRRLKELEDEYRRIKEINSLKNN